MGDRMKQVVSISLGSTQGDHQTVVQVAGEAYSITRIGTNGNLKRLQQLLRHYDGRVAAIGLGGINFSYALGANQYQLPQAIALKQAVAKTPLVDGIVVKDTLERHTVTWLQDKGLATMPGATALVVSVLDRYGMAEEMEQAGARVIVGDAMFGLGLPVPFYSLQSFRQVARITMPMLRWLPIQYLYPTGQRQLHNLPRWEKYYRIADYIVGDSHFIYRHMPLDLPGKTVITSTVTGLMLSEFQKRGLSKVITISPWWEGRAFGANVLEALIVAAYGLVTPGTVMEFAREINWEPALITF